MAFGIVLDRRRASSARRSAAVRATVRAYEAERRRAERRAPRIDAGYVANPDRAKAPMEGALIMAMSNTLYSAITFANGRAVEANFNTYGVTRLRAAPRTVDVHIVESEGLPGGIGEPGVPPAGAALANAIFAATGVRIRELPVAKQLAGWSTRPVGDSRE